MRCHSFVFLALVLVSCTLAGTLPTRSNHEATLAKRGAAPPQTVSGGWSYIGCFKDSPSNRVMSGASTHDDAHMTNEACAAFCDSQGYTMFGTEYARECFCGYWPDTRSSVPQSDASCNMACTGNANEACGAAGYIGAYRNYKSEPQPQQDSNGYQYLACYTDDTKSRSLGHAYRSPQGTGTMTVDICTTLCSKAGYGLAGLEYGDECWCDNKLSTSSQWKGSGGADSPCNMACKGNTNTWCGGKGSLSLYVAKPAAPAGWRDEGCYSDNTASRSLGVGVSVPGDFNNMTIEGCTSTCLAKGYQLAGVEYGRECYCASAGDNFGYFYSYEASQCSRLCTGNNLEICGGQDALNVYSYQGPATTPSSGNLVQNPSFEQNQDHWQVVNDPVYGAGQIGVSPFQELYANTGRDGNARSGLGHFSIGGYNSAGDQQTNNRGICISQYVYAPKYGTYYFEFYAGSIPRQSSYTDYHLTYTASVTGYNFDGPLCSGGTCTVQAVNGKSEYDKFGWYFTLSPGYVTVQICGRYNGVRPDQVFEDDILIDDVTLQFVTV